MVVDPTMASDRPGDGDNPRMEMGGVLSSGNTAASLFATYFLPLYPEDVLRDLEAARRTDVNPGGNKAVLAHLDDAAGVFLANAGRLFPGVDLELDFSDASVHRLSAALTTERRDAWKADGAAGSSSSALFNVVVHGAAYVGSCILKAHSGSWSVRRPLWETFVKLKSRAGEAELAVFHWWLKSLADDALQDAGASLADRYRTHVEVPCAKPEEIGRAHV